jgi:DAK2 domain fusion protein YloV
VAAPPPPDGPPPPAALGTHELYAAIHAAASWLDRNRERLNAINVYPVPDGDTGTNMVLTLRAALEGAGAADGRPPGEWLRALARGALLGARGNSGVILSQWLRGASEALQAPPVVDPAALAAALEHAGWVAYEAVSEPVEGTMLTVMRDAAQAAAGAAAAGGSILETLRAAVEEADRSVERTPELLPRLRAAGVVDAGGAGIAVVIAGLRMGVAGEALPAAPDVEGTVELAGVEHEGHGYCIEFVVESERLDRAAIAHALAAAGGTSTLVVGDAAALHVHVHMADPGPALSVGAAAGALSAVKVDNMQAQHERWADERQRAPVAAGGAGLVAVAAGPGVAAAFGALGAEVVRSDGGKPSAGQLLEAARRSGAAHVLLLPNDPDVRLAAEQAAAEAGGAITVVATRSFAAGLSAALSAGREGDPARVAAELREAAARVRCIEVTHAARDASVDGVTVRAGEPIALLDGVLAAAGADLEAALLAALARAATGRSELVTVYLGARAPADARERLTALIGAAHPALELEIVDGGQPYYPYVAGVE